VESGGLKRREKDNAETQRGLRRSGRERPNGEAREIFENPAGIRIGKIRLKDEGFGTRR